jgi:hypothetical protein
MSIFSKGTVVPGTQLAYDNIMFDYRRHNAAGHVPLSNMSGVPPHHKQIICKTMLDDWGITSPHTFQIQAVIITAFCPGLHLYIIAKTGSGKSAITLTTGSLGGAITHTLVPLIGLGSDLVSKSRNSSNYIEAYHLDEHKGLFGRDLRARLRSFFDRESRCLSVFLYILPQSLADTDSKSSW